MISWRKVTALLAIVAMLTVGGAFASGAPAMSDPLGVRATLDRFESQHRDTYAASNFAAAIVASRNGLALAERSGTLDDQIQFIRHLAYDNWLMGDNESAIEYSQRLLDCAELQDDNRIRAQAHRYLSQIYETMGDDLRSRSHAEEAFRLAQLAGDEDVRVFALTVVGQSEARAHHYEAALKAFEESYTHWKKRGRPWNAVNSLVNIADVAEARGDLADALKRYEEILAARIENNDRSGQVHAVAVIASLLRRLGRADEAMQRLAAARPLAESIGGHRLLGEFYTTIAQVQEARRDYSAALAMERQAATEREQLTGERARLRATELEARLELLQKQQAIDQLRTQVAVHEARLRAAAADLAQVRSFRISIIDGVMALAAIAFAASIVWRYRARTRRLNEAVYRAVPMTEKPAAEVSGAFEAK